ncbi:MAG: preprotein translocase subunit SecE [Tissierellia bacterium]|nr:preprotein translocase subunit SecE [Tissierellia bacterium]
MTEKKKKQSFFKGIRQEFKKIVWPSKDETVNSALVVFTSLIAVSVVIKIIDEILRFLLNLVV